MNSAPAYPAALRARPAVHQEQPGGARRAAQAYPPDHASHRRRAAPARPRHPGPGAALEWLARTYLREMAYCAPWNAEGIEHLSTTSAVTFRIVQEALTNVVRHAHASRADVSVVAHARRLAITVSDDGIGRRRQHPPGLRPARDRGARDHDGLLGRPQGASGRRHHAGRELAIRN